MFFGVRTRRILEARPQRSLNSAPRKWVIEELLFFPNFPGVHYVLVVARAPVSVAPQNNKINFNCIA